MKLAYILLAFALAWSGHNAEQLLALKDCPEPNANGYVLGQVYSACKCYLTVATETPVKVEFKVDGATVAQGNGSVTIEVGFNRDNNTIQNYECVSGDSQMKNFTTKFAYGAPVVGLVSSTGPFVYCPSKTGQQIEIVCTTDLSKGKPTGGSVVLVDGEQRFNYKPDGHSEGNATGGGEKEYYFKYVPTRGGQIDPYCLTLTSEFTGEINAGGFGPVKLSITGPPMGLPIMRFRNDTAIEDGTSKTVDIGNKNAELICQTVGGHPAPTSMKLSCGAVKAESQNKTSVILEMNKKTKFSSGDCTCTVEHVSKCYTTNKSTIKLKLKGAAGSNGNIINADCVQIAFGLIVTVFASVYRSM